jgi:signal peptidase I
MIDFDGSLMANEHPLADVLRGYIHEDKVARLTISSNSMAPLLKNGDVIGLRYANKTQLTAGQIITFVDSVDVSGLITHRLIKSQEDDQGNLLMLTRGDHALLFDRPWNADALVGKVVWRLRNGRLLRLDRGPGLWLSKQFGLNAEKERVRISGLPLSTLQLRGEVIKNANNTVRLRRKKLSSRLVRIVCRGGREFLSFLSILLAYREDDLKAMEMK